MIKCKTFNFLFFLLVHRTENDQIYNTSTGYVPNINNEMMDLMFKYNFDLPNVIMAPMRTQ